jgi:hypothetical protein
LKSKRKNKNFKKQKNIIEIAYCKPDSMLDVLYII